MATPYRKGQVLHSVFAAALYKAVAANKITGLVMAYKIWVRSPEQMALAILRRNLPGYF
ncbi:hypothetical protein GIW68_22010 [Pseudomonas lactis]|uniref:hypothetical protein n=1 Tax=Pseudomonas lactis TaxID=1615674 RepID=UPI001F2A0C9F|nr:hypothetical protein [Pseudomonas lactis]MCF5003293.1 hypothetical protein [Pseudomonas lactis]